MMPLPRKTIAIVDDDCQVRKALERQLTAAGYRCASFASGEDFVARAADVDASCLLADINLDGMTGLDLALHPVVTGLDLPVVLITASSDPQVEASAREIAAAFLRKPFLSQTLLDAIVDTVGAPIHDDLH